MMYRKKIKLGILDTKFSSFQVAEQRVSIYTEVKLFPEKLNFSSTLYILCVSVCMHACMHDVLCMRSNVYDVSTTSNRTTSSQCVCVYACVHMMYEFKYVCCVSSTCTMHQFILSRYFVYCYNIIYILQGISKCRDEELEHLDTGLEHGAENVRLHNITLRQFCVPCSLYYSSDSRLQTFI